MFLTFFLNKSRSYCTKIHFLITFYKIKFTITSTKGHLHWKNYHLYQVHWHQHARGGSLGGDMHDLYGESTNKTGGRVWISTKSIGWTWEKKPVIFSYAMVNLRILKITFNCFLAYNAIH
jgi:hypothetical protein